MTGNSNLLVYLLVVLLFVLTNPPSEEVRSIYYENINYSHDVEDTEEILSRITILRTNLLFFSIYKVEDPFHGNYTLETGFIQSYNEENKVKQYIGFLTVIIPLD